MKTEHKIIGKPTPKIDAGIRITGKAIYGHDIKLPGMLFGAILRAEHPCAEFNIDVSDAKKLPGVICVITANDIDCNNINYKRDHPILKKGEVNCIRDEIAAVAAETKEIAVKALKLIKVNYKFKQGIYDPEDALHADAPLINKYLKDSKFDKNIADLFHYQHGDLEEQKNKSKVIISKRYVLPRVTHCCLATSNITADYSPVTKKLTLYSSTQVPFLYQRDIAHALKINPSDIRVIQVVIGGGFGSKLDMYPFEPIAAILSMKTGKPVQILFDREEEFIASPTRQNMVIDLKTGADKDGKFTFRDVKILKDNGAYTSWGATTPFVMMQTFSSLYQVPACRFESKAVYTNNVYAGSFRGYGNPQATFALESSIDLIAEELGMDKAEIRLLNSNYKGEITGQGLNFHTCGHIESLNTVFEKAKIKKRPINADSKRYLYGTGYASMLHVGGGAKIYRSDGCGTILKLDDYGFLTIITGSNEIGQGSETVLAMMASEELSIPISKIKVVNTDTDVKPWDVGVHASRTTFVAGNSLLGAIKELKQKLNIKASEILGTQPDRLEYVDEEIRQIEGKTLSIRIEKVVREMHFGNPHELCMVNYFFEPSSKFQDKDFKGDVSGSYAFAAQAVNVEVDTYTGNIKVLDIHVAQDVGKVLNPLGIQGQIEGGVLMGIGYAISEELIMEEGKILNPNFHNYKMLTASDVPQIHFYPIETNDPQGPYGAKGMAEAPLIPTAAAIANAVANAIGSRIYSLPLNPEKVLKALSEKKVKELDFIEN
jgi:CO/xanthine dehydrogenase Mo-binding subunit